MENCTPKHAYNVYIIHDNISTKIDTYLLDTSIPIYTLIISVSIDWIYYIIFVLN